MDRSPCGRDPIGTVAQGYSGTNTGPDGTGKAVRCSGYEEWTVGDDGLIAQSPGHYDEGEYARKLEDGVGG